MSKIPNTLGDLNNYLFEQMERLNECEAGSEELEKEIKRSKAMGKTAGAILKIGELEFKVAKEMAEYGGGFNAPKLLQLGNVNE